ncbi:hypothetical protein TNCV_597251 [Trichonephila clavipes]|nr:hypothetical protein TNCV_597251 [Trichonephila clavipes]
MLIPEPKVERFVSDTLSKNFSPPIPRMSSIARYILIKRDDRETLEVFRPHSEIKARSYTRKVAAFKEYVSTEPVTQNTRNVAASGAFDVQSNSPRHRRSEARPDRSTMATLSEDLPGPTVIDLFPVPIQAPSTSSRRDKYPRR